ncbi:MAG: GreA/GreB family elongation factor [Proteobacteria bacterium]|nr:GreA/GreB family elongation factor [Pseudomonadota bacterium]
MSNESYQRPPIIVAEHEHERLTGLALSALDHTPGAVDLFAELSRAATMKTLPETVVSVGSVATFEFDGSFYRDYELVDPHRADIAQRRISVLTPVGAMLLGLSEGQSIGWVGPDERAHRVVVERVRPRGVNTNAAAT